MINVKHPIFLKHCLCVCLFFLLLSHLLFAEEPKRHICKDYNSENEFSFVPPKGWRAVNVDDIPGKGGNKISRLLSWLDASPQKGPATAVCHQVKKSNYKQPLIFISRVYNLNGTGTELEEKWLTEKYYKKKQGEIYSKDALFSSNSYITNKFPSIRLDDIEIADAHYYYRQDAHTAVEYIEGTIKGKQFIRIRAIILGGLRHAGVFCHFEEPHHPKAEDVVDQIINTFEFDSENVFGGPLDKSHKGEFVRRKRAGRIIMLLSFSPSMLLGALGIWLSARYYGIQCKIYVALIASIIATIATLAGLFISFRMPYLFLIFYIVTAYVLLALFIREDYEELMKVAGFGLLGALIPFIALYIYFMYMWIGAASAS